MSFAFIVMLLLYFMAQEAVSVRKALRVRLAFPEGP